LMLRPTNRPTNQQPETSRWKWRQYCSDGDGDCDDIKQKQQRSSAQIRMDASWMSIFGRIKGVLLYIVIDDDRRRWRYDIGDGDPGTGLLLWLVYESLCGLMDG
jgi:hypothetical protein